MAVRAPEHIADHESADGEIEAFVAFVAAERYRPGIGWRKRRLDRLVLQRLDGARSGGFRRCRRSGLCLRLRGGLFCRRGCRLVAFVEARFERIAELDVLDGKSTRL